VAAKALVVSGKGFLLLHFLQHLIPKINGVTFFRRFFFFLLDRDISIKIVIHIVEVITDA
jgi:hypothetical protein